MPDRTTQRELDKFDALLQLLVDDGATPSGRVPAAHVEEMRTIDDVDREHVGAIVDAHANGDPPPGGKP